MSDTKTIFAIVEGLTEQKFIAEILAPYLALENIFLYATTLQKPGENGGDVRFSRAQNDIGKFLKQQTDTQVTLMLDYYGIRNDWPGYDKSKQESTHTQKHEVLIRETMKKVCELFPFQHPQSRFIPYFSMHEIEALYFSNPEELARNLNVEKSKIEYILRECGEPEKINDNSKTAPSKRLEALFPRFKKISTGLIIAKAIGIPTMQTACPLFDAWITKLKTSH